jgi:predicted SnoaL-like aldol condensation-catalyzing enzyme
MPENQKSEAQKSLVTRWFEEVWNQNRAETIDELLPANCVIHDAGTDMRGPEEFKTFHDGLRAQFSEIRVSLHESISEGDMVCFRWACTMQHRNTGKTVRITGISMVRFDEGRLAEAWQNWDLYGMMQQIEAAPARAHGAAG